MMFTGIVEGIGKIEKISKNTKSLKTKGLKSDFDGIFSSKNWIKKKKLTR